MGLREVTMGVQMVFTQCGVFGRQLQGRFCAAGRNENQHGKSK
jgi:hypothetical protein